MRTALLFSSLCWAASQPNSNVGVSENERPQTIAYALLLSLLVLPPIRLGIVLLLFPAMPGWRDTLRCCGESHALGGSQQLHAEEPLHGCAASHRAPGDHQRPPHARPCPGAARAPSAPRRECRANAWGPEKPVMFKKKAGGGGGEIVTRGGCKAGNFQFSVSGAGLVFKQ